MTGSRSGFLTAGTWSLDRNIAVPCWPGEDMFVPAVEVVRAGGGSGCNFAVNLRRLDPSVPVDTIGLIGDDDNGDFLAEVAAQHGIGHAGLARTADAPTHVTDAYQSLESGRRTHIGFEGASALLTPDHFDFARTSRAVLHLGLPGTHARMDAAWEDDPSGWVTVLRRARAHGMRTNLELVAVGAEKLRALALPCLPYLTYLVINDYEIGAIADLDTTSRGIPDEDAIRRAAATVLERGAMELVVVHYVSGALLCHRDGSEIRHPSVAVPESEIRGANGAGDAFAAGFFYGLQSAWPHDRCLAMAHAAAAASLRSVTTYGGVGDYRECLELAAGWGWR